MTEPKQNLVEAWRNLDGSRCPFCETDRSSMYFPMDESLLSDDFNLENGGHLTEFYSCEECGAKWSIGRRFAPAGDIVFEVEE